MEFRSKRLRVKVCEDSSSGPTPMLVEAEPEQELTMCDVYSALCVGHSCDPGEHHCYGELSCESQNSNCYAESGVPVFVGPEGDRASLVRARDLPLLRLGIDAQRQKPSDPSA